MAPVVATAALDGTDLAKGEQVHPQVGIVLYADVPPQNTVLGTLVSSDIENPNVTQGLGSMGPVAVLTSSCEVTCQAVLQVCRLRPMARCLG